MANNGPKSVSTLPACICEDSLQGTQQAIGLLSKGKSRKTQKAIHKIHSLRLDFLLSHSCFA